MQLAVLVKYVELVSCVFFLDQVKSVKDEGNGEQLVEQVKESG